MEERAAVLEVRIASFVIFKLIFEFDLMNVMTWNRGLCRLVGQRATVLVVRTANLSL